MENETQEVKTEVIPKKEDTKQSFWELVRFAVIAVLIVIPIRVFIAQPFIVSGASMFPTFHDGDYLIVDEISYRFNQPKRDEVIIFRYPKNPQKFYIKRIIGLPNETVDILGSQIKITNAENKDGFILEQPFVQNESNNQLHFELKEDEYFVMGDNRSASSDSRFWGPVPSDLIIGKAFVRLLPLNKIELLPGAYNQVQ